MTDRLQQLVSAAQKIARLQHAVECGGGQWVGVQHIPDFPQLPALALFTGPNGSTLALPAVDVTAKAVKQKIAESEARFAGAAA